jgi:hypothetical protein
LLPGLQKQDRRAASQGFNLRPLPGKHRKESAAFLRIMRKKVKETRHCQEHMFKLPKSQIQF